MQNQQEGGQQVIYAPDQPGAGSDLPSVLDRTDPKAITHMLKCKLRGMEFDEENQVWFLPKEAMPMLNERGIRSIMVDVSSVLNQNSVLSNLEDEHISQIIIGLGDCLVLKLMQRYLEFGVDIAELDTIVFSILNACFLCLRRSYHNLERIFHKGTLSEQRHIIEGTDSRKKGLSLFGGTRK